MAVIVGVSDGGYSRNASYALKHCVYTSSVGRLLDLEGIMGPVVSVSITRSIPLRLVDY
jgi:hypothetical protein